MPTAKQGHEKVVDDLLLPDDHLGHLLLDPRASVAQPGDDGGVFVGGIAAFHDRAASAGLWLEEIGRVRLAIIADGAPVENREGPDLAPLVLDPEGDTVHPGQGVMPADG